MNTTITSKLFILTALLLISGVTAATESVSIPTSVPMPESEPLPETYVAADAQICIFVPKAGTLFKTADSCQIVTQSQGGGGGQVQLEISIINGKGVTRAECTRFCKENYFSEIGNCEAKVKYLN